MYLKYILITISKVLTAYFLSQFINSFMLQPRRKTLCKVGIFSFLKHVIISVCLYL